MKAIAAFGNIVSLFIIPLLLPDLTAACGYTGEEGEWIAFIFLISNSQRNKVGSDTFVLQWCFEGVIFSYSGATGPDKWGTLSPQFRACSNGKHQSPINIVRKQAIWNSNLRPLEIDYTPTNATLVNNVYNIMVCFISEHRTS